MTATHSRHRIMRRPLQGARPVHALPGVAALLVLVCALALALVPPAAQVDAHAPARASAGAGGGGGVVAWGNNSEGEATVPAAATSGVIAVSGGPVSQPGAEERRQRGRLGGQR